MAAKVDDPKELVALVEELGGLQKKTSELRKRGGDTRMAELMLIPMKSKIEYARASQEQKDYQKVQGLLAKIREELADIERQLAEDVEKVAAMEGEIRKAETEPLPKKGT